MKEIIFGIDLGTTNSCIAYMNESTPIVIANPEGMKTAPSIVAFKKDGNRLQIIVGEKAKRQMITNHNTIYSVKRKMGGGMKYDIFDKQYTPEEISSDILRYLYDFASKKLNTNSNKVIITVPAYFNETQRQATIDAGKIAGLDVIKIINEPTAAALAYGLDKKDQKQTVLVYDLGGGTFDVSILKIGDKDNNGETVFKVLATNGNKHLGGDDWDQVIMDEIISQIKNEYLIDVSKDKEIMQRIKDASEKAKIELSSATSTKIDLPFLSKTKDGTPINFSYELTRDQFEQTTKFLLDQTKDPVNQAINDAHLNVTDIDEVLLVGGSTRMPAVENLVRSLTGKEPNRTINPDEVVAIGAAVQGGLISGNVTKITLDDITPLSLGTIDYQGKNIVVIPKNTSIPVTLTQHFTTVEDNQSSIRFEVTQGESHIGKENEIIGEFVIKGIRKAPAGVPNIELTYTMNENGILHCTAYDADTNNEVSIDINTSNLTDDELNEKIKENERIRKEEQKRQEEAEKEYRNKTNFK